MAWLDAPGPAKPADWDDVVTRKHAPATADGKLATPNGVVLDTQYPWIAVLRLLPPAPAAPVA